MEERTMLYEGSLVIMALVMAVMVIGAYRLGLRDGRAVEKKKPLPQLIPKINKPSKPSEHNHYYHKLLQDIDRYDGWKDRE